MKYDALAKNFWANVERIPGFTCWFWSGTVSGRGYGRIFHKGITYAAHRVSAALHGREIPDSMLADHLCRNRLCVNPDHIRAVNNRTNSIENSVGPTALNAQKTHCDKGNHLLGKPNKFGKRRCKECERLRGRARRAAAKK